MTRLLSLLTVLFDPLAGFLAQRAASLLCLFHRFGLRDLLSDFFRDDFFGFEVFAHPAAHLFGDVDESLHWRQPGCPVLAHGHRAHEADRVKGESERVSPERVSERVSPRIMTYHCLSFFRIHFTALLCR